MTFESGTADAPVVATPKGKVVILNGASVSTRTAILGALESQLVDYKTRVVDSYIMTKPDSCDLIERDLRSVYIQQVLKSADQGHTILLTARMLNGSEGQRDVENILSLFRGKQIPSSGSMPILDPGIRNSAAALRQVIGLHTWAPVRARPYVLQEQDMT